MKVLALIGSDRKNGNTARIIEMFEAQMQAFAKNSKLPFEFESFYIGNFSIKPCRGCRVCFDQGEEACPLRDDIPLIRTKMDVADVLLVASPVYVNDVSGLIKNWMDRLAYLCHRPAMDGKCAYAIATVGGGSFRHALHTMNTALLTWGYHLAGQAGFKMGALAPTDQWPNYQTEVKKMSEKLIQSVKEKAPLNPAFISLLAFRVQQLTWQNEKPGTLDYVYWRSMGWLEPKCSFYFNHNSGKVKNTLAHLSGTLLFRFLG
jgi:multimeric flavodoxin WrbA